MKRLVLMAVVAVAAATARSSVLYWQIQNATDEARGTPIAWDYVTITAGDSEDPLYYYSGSVKTGYQEWWSSETDPTSTDGAAFFGDFDDSVTSFSLQLCDADGNTIGWQTYDRSAVQEHIFSSIAAAFSGGANATPATFSNVIPEPSSGLLMIFGLAALALRRRRAKAIASVAVAAAVLVPSLAFCDQDDMLLKFYAKSDHYADGVPVFVGERYALVWSPEGTEPTFYADGTIENGKIIKTLSVSEVKKSTRQGKKVVSTTEKCCNGEFAINVHTYENEIKSGTWAVYLLDTRSWGADGVAALSAFDENANEAASNSAVGFAALVTMPTALDLDSEKQIDLPRVEVVGVQATKETELPADAPKPVITAINVKDGKVEVKVKNTASYIQYALRSGDDPSSVEEAVGNPQAGQENEVVFTAPVSANAAFFKVGRR